MGWVIEGLTSFRMLPTRGSVKRINEGWMWSQNVY